MSSERGRGRLTVWVKNIKTTADFPRQHRLLNGNDFKHVFDNAEKMGSGPFVILVAQNKMQHSRLGVILSKKKIPKAVQRNRIRRLIREHFRINTSFKGVDMVILPKHGIDVLSNTDLDKGLQKGWRLCEAWASKSLSV